MKMQKLELLIKEISNNEHNKIDLACAFVWYHYVSFKEEVTIKIINHYFVDNHFSKYNETYLKRDLRNTRNISKGTKTGFYKPQRKYLEEMLVLYPFMEEKSEEIYADDLILPDELMKNTRGYIENLSKQINACYQYNIFDGCLILMRRLLEILLVHSYEANHKIQDITEKDSYKNLKYIINDLSSNKPFLLSNDTISSLNHFREVGNFSAHKIKYNAKKKDVDNIKLNYRVAIEELLYTAHIKK